MAVLEEYYDAVIIGAGHAGCEAALACARLGLETIVFTVSVESIAMMPCNPPEYRLSIAAFVCNICSKSDKEPLNPIEKLGLNDITLPPLKKLLLVAKLVSRESKYTNVKQMVLLYVQPVHNNHPK